MSDGFETISAIATRLAGVTRSIACKGTPLESTTFTRGGKAFLFHTRKGEMHVLRLKLQKSVDEAKSLAAKETDRYDLGANGWAKVTFFDTTIPTKVLEKWIAESYAAMGDAPPKKAAPAAKTAKRKAPAARKKK